MLDLSFLHLLNMRVVVDGDLNVLDDILAMEDDFDDERDEKKELHSGKCQCNQWSLRRNSNTFCLCGEIPAVES